ncbi:MAG: WXG100 family type VII secretion target [Actinomycetales bacterium]|nr:WXG100 family type VII secretion target [Actinomycetales bacterium]
MTFKANFGGIATASSDIGTAANNLEQKLNDMDSQLQALRSDWTGEAAESYQRAKTAWTTAISDMKVLLSEIGSQVGQDGQDFQAGDNRNARRFD